MQTTYIQLSISHEDKINVEEILSCIFKTLKSNKDIEDCEVLDVDSY